MLYGHALSKFFPKTDSAMVFYSAINFDSHLLTSIKKNYIIIETTIIWKEKNATENSMT